MFKSLQQVLRPQYRLLPAACRHLPFVAVFNFISRAYPVRGFAVATKKAPVPEVKIVKNEEINYPEMRVVFKSDDGKDDHKVMSRLEALNLAKSKSMDLILVNPNSTPPVCRLGDAGAKKRVVEKKQKEIRATQRARTVKEMHIGSSIFENDLNTKLNKVREFLESFHPVRVSFIADAKVLEKNPLSLDEIILKVLQLLEKDAGPVQPMPVRSRLRRDILFNPKPAAEGVKKKK